MKIKSNPNTPKMWDQLNFEKNNMLLKSPIYKDKLKKVIKELKYKSGKVLDIGFGYGNLEIQLSKINRNLELYGIDFSSKSVKEINKRKIGKFYKGNIYKLPFEDGNFDIIIILDVLEHIEKRRIMEVLKEVGRVLKKSGYIIISVPLNENIKLLNKLNMNINGHVREYDFNILKNELHKNNIDIYKHYYLTAFSNLYTIKNLILKLWPNFREPNLLIVYGRKK